MNDLAIFKNPKFGEVRTVVIDGKEYFVAADVARNLGYAKPQNAVSAHCKGALKRGIPTNGGMQEMTVIPIGDVCRLAANSELPGAPEYESWIFDEVIPVIHKTGAYLQRPLSTLEIMAKSVEILQQHEQQIQALTGQVQTIKDTICDRPEDWRAEVNELLNSAAYRAGGGDKYREIKQYSYDELDRRAAARIEIRLDNMKERMAGKIPKKAYDKLCYLDVIAEDKRLREIYWQIVKEIAIKYAA